MCPFHSRLKRVLGRTSAISRTKFAAFWAGLLRRARTIEQTPARIIEVIQPVGLQPVSHDPEQQMTE
jgi:hypothetical protein